MVIKCCKCNSEWNTNVVVQKCPFCGEALSSDVNPATDVSEALKIIIAQRGIEILHSPKTVRSMVLDILSGNEREKKLFSIACENGVLEQTYIISKEADEDQQKLLIMKLRNDLVQSCFLALDFVNAMLQMILGGCGISDLSLLEDSQKKNAENMDGTSKKTQDINDQRNNPQINNKLTTNPTIPSRNSNRPNPQPGVANQNKPNREKSAKPFSAQSSCPEYVIVNNVIIGYNGHDSNIIIPDGVYSIDKFAFQNKHFIKNVTFPSSLRELKGFAFQGCTGLTSVTIPKGVLKIDGFVFQNCINLTTIHLLNPQTRIGQFVFNGCGKIKIM